MLNESDAKIIETDNSADKSNTNVIHANQNNQLKRKFRNMLLRYNIMACSDHRLEKNEISDAISEGEMICHEFSRH